MQKKIIKTLKGAPPHVRKWWSRTGVEAALFRLVENGATWDEAHERLKARYTAHWDKSSCSQGGVRFLLRFANRVERNRILDRVEAGEKAFYREMGGRVHVAVVGSSFVLLRRGMKPSRPWHEAS